MKRAQSDNSNLDDESIHSDGGNNSSSGGGGNSNNRGGQKRFRSNEETVRLLIPSRVSKCVNLHSKIL